MLSYDKKYKREYLGVILPNLIDENIGMARKDVLKFIESQGSSLLPELAEIVNGDDPFLSMVACDTIAGMGAMPGFIGATSSNNRNTAMLADPIANGWSYQSYGVWITGLGVGGTQGGISYGNPSTVVPLAGTATFAGNAAAIYVNPIGVPALATANMTANVDFGALTVAWGTSNTVLANSVVAKNVTSTVAAPQLDANGLLTISGTQFTGAAQTNNLNLTGQAAGQFYGPNATEIGGTYGLRGNGVESLRGAFGGKIQ